MHIAVQGLFEGSPNGHGRLTVDGMGVYLRDSYDFTGNQDLGFWNSKDVTSWAVNSLDIPIVATAKGNDADWYVGAGSLSVRRERFFRVTNRSFGMFRNLAKRGGDFTIFTDVHRLPMLTRSIEINL